MREQAIQLHQGITIEIPQKPNFDMVQKKITLIFFFLL